MPDAITPTTTQLNNCERWGWDYLGDGIFTKGEWLGYFTKQGFKKR